VHINADPGAYQAVDRVIAVEGLGSFERLQRAAREHGFSRIDREEEGGAAIELWGP
jgi:hypothetical protein